MSKILQPNHISLVLWMSIAPLFLLANFDADKEQFELLSERLNEAIEARNFQDARTTIEELMPLMKEALKEDKKELSALKKEDNPTEDPASFQKKLDRKTELYNSLKKLVGVSPAALRSKSKLIKEEVSEFIELS
ncbi:hypothetical protein [Marinoscillum sp.]|uniref:hypothetical protein n=1 Tax=Marinoscillum sp. TaxID=2024838 RepID=UPI003BAC3F02